MAENFARRLEATARRTPDKPALVWEGGALTFGEIDERADALAATGAREAKKALKEEAELARKQRSAR